MGGERAGADADVGDHQAAAVQMLVELDVTDLVPSPVVATVAVKPPPLVPLEGRFEIDGVLGVAGPTEKVWGLPSAAE